MVCFDQHQINQAIPQKSCGITSTKVQQKCYRSEANEGFFDQKECMSQSECKCILL